MRITLANQSLSTLTENVLPALSGSTVSYCKEHNIYVSQGYTSVAGNTYYQGLRLSDRLIVMYEFGQGWAHLFLNGIRLYCYDGREKKLISAKKFNCQYFNEVFARSQCVQMLREFLETQAKILGAIVQPSQLNSVSESMVQDLMRGPLRHQIA